MPSRKKLHFSFCRKKIFNHEYAIEFDNPSKSLNPNPISYYPHKYRPNTLTPEILHTCRRLPCFQIHLISICIYSPMKRYVCAFEHSLIVSIKSHLFVLPIAFATYQKACIFDTCIAWNMYFAVVIF